MNYSRLITRWQMCEKIAEDLGMRVSTNGAELLSAQGREGDTGFKGFYVCESVDELLGYLNGVSDAKRKLGVAP